MLMAALPTFSAFAEDTGTSKGLRIDYCLRLSDLAETISESRQNGHPMGELVVDLEELTTENADRLTDVASKWPRLVGLAYSMEVGETPNDKILNTTVFRGGVFELCYEVETSPFYKK